MCSSLRHASSDRCDGNALLLSPLLIINSLTQFFFLCLWSERKENKVMKE